jgi:hypothetical protein
MSSASVTNDFTNGLIGDADEVDQNFQDLVNFLNSHVVHKGETALEAKSGSPGEKYQKGTFTAALTNGQVATSTVKAFDFAFTTIPLVFIMQDEASNSYVWQISARTTTNFTIVMRKPDNTAFGASGSVSMMYLAIGT